MDIEKLKQAIDRAEKMTTSQLHELSIEAVGYGDNEDRGYLRLFFKSKVPTIEAAFIFNIYTDHHDRLRGITDDSRKRIYDDEGKRLDGKRAEQPYLIEHRSLKDIIPKPTTWEGDEGAWQTVKEIESMGATLTHKDQTISKLGKADILKVGQISYGWDTHEFIVDLEDAFLIASWQTYA
jgi:hypothetical protein